VDFLYGDADLDIQESALISFDFNDMGLNVNKSNDVLINVTTNSTVEQIKVFSVLENSPNNPNFYNIKINESNTYVSGSDLKIQVDNFGRTTVTLDSVYINDTYIPLNLFYESIFDIGINSYLELTIDLGLISVTDDLPYKILVRSKEGAEDLVDHHIV